MFQTFDLMMREFFSNLQPDLIQAQFKPIWKQLELLEILVTLNENKIQSEDWDCNQINFKTSEKKYDLILTSLPSEQQLWRDLQLWKKNRF